MSNLFLRSVRLALNDENNNPCTHLKVFVIKGSPIDAFASSSVKVGEVSALAHESRNNSVKGTLSVTKTRFSSAQLAKVFGSLWNNITYNSTVIRCQYFSLCWDKGGML